MGDSGHVRWGKGVQLNDRPEEITTVDEGPAPPSGGAPIGAVLEILTGSEEGSILLVEKTRCVLGRGGDADIRLPDPTVSRRHMELTLRDGVFHLEELSSSNGTRVDGRNVHGTVKLRQRCKLRVGKRTELEFTAVDEAGLSRARQRMHLTARLELERKYSRTLAEQATMLRAAHNDLVEFARATSHDLRAPLHNIGALAELLALQYRGQLDDKADAHLTNIVETVHRMDVLLEELREYSQSREDKPRQLVDLHDVVDDARDNLRSVLESAGAVVEADHLPTVSGYPTELARLLQNLFENAVKFRSQAPPFITVRAAAADDEWVISVSDNGIGVDSRDPQAIFRVFKRLHREDEYPGTGIGLAVAQRVAHMHGGRIWVESAPGRGSTFHFTIERDPDELSSRDTLDPDGDEATIV